MDNFKQRPEKMNLYAPDTNKVYCSHEHESGYLCTREPGHSGEHAAHGGFDNQIATWNQDNIEPASGDTN